MSASAPEPITTAGLRPELFTEPGSLPLSRNALIIALILLTLAGLSFRASALGAEALSEDELNKLEAVADYRAHGLTAANGEHPFLMKAMQTVSLLAAERWNRAVSSNAPSAAAASHPYAISTEAALRVPSALFGALTVIVLYLLVAELFGKEAALLAAALWAFDPAAIGFNRIAKEDTFLLFFFLLANVFWLKGQRVAESGRGRPQRYYWATAASFGAMLASKYVLQLLAVSVSYNYIFQGIPQTRWRIGKKRFLIFFIIMGAVFLLLNPTILLPATWQQMMAFASYKRIGHDGYEFLGRVYSHKLTDWLYGVPWYFYFVFMWVKLPLATIAAFIVGLPVVVRRRMGDGRFFLFFWVLIGFVPFMLVGGKFTRYFAPVLPVVLIIASLGAQRLASLLSRRLSADERRRSGIRAGLYTLVLISSLWASVDAWPHYRLYTNLLGGGEARSGSFFPQDEFYDAAIRDIMREIANRARVGALVATETPGLAAYYAEQLGRKDLRFVSLSNRASLDDLSEGDFLMVERGRRYFSNEALIESLKTSARPAFSISVGRVPAADVYILDNSTLALIKAKPPASQ